MDIILKNDKGRSNLETLKSSEGKEYYLLRGIGEDVDKLHKNKKGRNQFRYWQDLMASARFNGQAHRDRLRGEANKATDVDALNEDEKAELFKYYRNEYEGKPQEEAAPQAPQVEQEQPQEEPKQVVQEQPQEQPQEQEPVPQEEPQEQPQEQEPVPEVVPQEQPQEEPKVEEQKVQEPQAEEEEKPLSDEEKEALEKEVGVDVDRLVELQRAKQGAKDNELDEECEKEYQDLLSGKKYDGKFGKAKQRMLGDLLMRNRNKVFREVASKRNEIMEIVENKFEKNPMRRVQKAHDLMTSPLGMDVETHERLVEDFKESENPYKDAKFDEDAYYLYRNDVDKMALEKPDKVDEFTQYGRMNKEANNKASAIKKGWYKDYLKKKMAAQDEEKPLSDEEREILEEEVGVDVDRLVELSMAKMGAKLNMEKQGVKEGAEEKIDDEGEMEYQDLLSGKKYDGKFGKTKQRMLGDLIARGRGEILRRLWILGMTLPWKRNIVQ